MNESTKPRITRSPVRCPYCHERVERERGAWVACSGCLARHHADCWMGQSGCASCSHDKALLPVTALTSARDRLRRHRREPRVGRAMAFGALLMFQLGLALAGLALLDEVSTAEATIASSVAQEEEPTRSPRLDYETIELRQEVQELREELLTRHFVQEQIAVEARRQWAERIAERDWREAASKAAAEREAASKAAAEREAASKAAAEREAASKAAAEERVEILELKLAAAKGRAELATTRATHLSRLAASLEADLIALRKEYAVERKQLQDLQWLLDMCESPSPRRGFSQQLPGPPVPAIDGSVLASGLPGAPESVVLSVGATHGVEKGYRFSIYRGSEFVGKVIVRDVHVGVAFCETLFTAEGHAIETGDNAATRLN